MNSEKLRVAVLQLTSIDSVSANLQQIEKLLSEIPGPVDLVCLPENSLFMRIKEGEKIEGLRLNDPAFSTLQSWAERLECLIHCGSVPLRKENGLANASVMVRAEGVDVSYEKIHLFDIALENAPPIRESDVFKAGDRPVAFKHENWHLGQTICYDLRFSELFSVYARQSVDLILVPSAFLPKTGQAHWEVLLRARAIESQCFIVAAAQGGEHHGLNGGLRRTYGHSLVVGPWGDVLAQASPNNPEVLYVELMKNDIKKVRTQIPMSQHRKL